MRPSRILAFGVALLGAALLVGCSAGQGRDPGTVGTTPAAQATATSPVVSSTSPTQASATPAVTRMPQSSTQSSSTPAQPAQGSASTTTGAPADWRSIGIDPAAPSSTPLAAAQATAALTVLATLPVKGRAPKTGYARAQFSTNPGNSKADVWTDDSDTGLDAPFAHNGCDTRNDILARDMSGVSYKTGTHCKVLTGVLADPYTATTIDFVCGPKATTTGACQSSSQYAERVQIDHVDALSDAWQTGAQSWDTTTRVAFANDPLNLLAVDGPTNESKGDGDAASWLPANKAFRTSYVARQVAVKAKYGLWVTPAEHDAIARILQGA